MILCRVIGNVWATRKEENLVGNKFLIVQTERPDGIRESEIFVAVDRIGAGVGDLVLVTRGSSARIVFSKGSPIDAVIIGIVDSVDAEVNDGE